MKNDILYLILIFSFSAKSQMNFKSEVNAIQEKNKHLIKTENKHIVFTGSSSIRIWENLFEIFKDSTIINTGFGGSKASDLLYYIDELVINFNPKKVVIYEGDNDINSGQEINFIYKNILKIIERIKDKNDKIKIILISAKPSISRWHLRDKYIQLNQKYRELANKSDFIEFADTWSAMIENGVLKKDIFIEDGLHLNEKGYEIWEKTLKKVFYK
ncbi:MAG: GDSL-type esterase/lipase family protein [Candidatus Marivariicella sp.]|tara:strand:- start:6311 stop:6955 length:645 start_codon:yes stop_codon:yes gene_type:complete